MYQLANKLTINWPGFTLRKETICENPVPYGVPSYDTVTVIQPPFDVALGQTDRPWAVARGIRALVENDTAHCEKF
jgi:hypothetical protein